VRTLALPLLLTFALAAHAAPAQPTEAKRAEARKHVERAQMYYKLGEYDKALVEFSLAYQLVSKPILLFNLGQSARLMGDAVKARDYYQRYLAEEEKIEPAVRTEVEGYIAQINRTLEPPKQAAAPAPAPAPPPPPPRPPPPDPKPAPVAAPAPDPKPAPTPVAKRVPPEKTRTIAAHAPAAPRAPTPEAISPVAPEPVRPTPPAVRPFYKTWWFWTAVGVIAASGTAAVIVASSGDEEPPPDTKLGTVRF